MEIFWWNIFLREKKGNGSKTSNEKKPEDDRCATFLHYDKKRPDFRSFQKKPHIKISTSNLIKKKNPNYWSERLFDKGFFKRKE